MIVAYYAKFLIGLEALCLVWTTLADGADEFNVKIMAERRPLL